jgi:hypothetical protein
MAKHPVKPWRYRSWISPRAPDFESRAAVILDLYPGVPAGTRLQPGGRIESVEPSPPSRPAAAAVPPPRPRGTPMRVEHEYVRLGALVLLATLDAHTWNLFAAIPYTTGIARFMNLIGQGHDGEVVGGGQLT